VRTVENDTLYLYKGLEDTDLGTEALWARDRLEELAQDHPQQVATLVEGISDRAGTGIFSSISPDQMQAVVQGFEHYVEQVAFPEGVPDSAETVLDR